MERQSPAWLDDRHDRAAGVDRARGMLLRRLGTCRQCEVHEHGGEGEEGSHDEEIGKGDPSFR